MSLKNLIGFAFLLPAFLMSCKKSTPSPTTSGDFITRSELDGVARSEAVTFVIGDTAYLATGFDGLNRLNDVWKFDPVGGWNVKARFPGVARNSAVGFSIGSNGYLGTGYDGANNLNDFWQFNPALNTWTRKADFAGSPRYDAVGFGILNNGYISTGFDGNYLKDLWIYNPVADNWTQGVSLGGLKRSGAVAFVYNNKAYITTGNNNGSVSTVNDLWMYDPSTLAWTAERKISNVSSDTYDDGYTSIVRNNAVAFVMGSKAYITTGLGASGADINDTWEYDFATDLWAQKSSFEGTARDGAVSFTVKARGFLGTGKNSTQPFDDLFEFDPNATLVTGN